MPYSEDRVKETIELIHEKLDAYKNMPIKDRLFAVFIDAYHASMRVDNKVKDVAIYTALDIDMEGYKHILGFWGSVNHIYN